MSGPEPGCHGCGHAGWAGVCHARKRGDALCCTLFQFRRMPGTRASQTLHGPCWAVLLLHCDAPWWRASATRTPCAHGACPCGHISSPAFALRLVAHDGARDAARIIFGPGRIAKAQLARSCFPCGAADERHENLRAVATRVNDRASTVARSRLPPPSPPCVGANPPPWTVLFTCRAV